MIWLKEGGTMEGRKSLHICGTATDIYISAMLLAFPLFTGFKGYTQITAAKLALFLGLTGLWLAAIILGLFLDRDRPELRLGPESALILLCLAACCLSAVLSPYGARDVLIGAGRFDGLLHTLLCVLIFIGVRIYGRFRPRYAYCLCVSVGICCIVTIIQFTGSNPLKLFPGDFTYYDMGTLYSGEFLGTIGNGNLFSAFLCLCLPVLFGLYICGYINEFIVLPCLLLGGFCLFECSVSAGKLALCVCLLAAPPVLVTESERLKRLLRVLGVFALALGLSVCFSGKMDKRDVLLSFQISKAAECLFAGSVAAFILSCFPLAQNMKAKGLRLLLGGVSVLLLASALLFAYTTKAQEGTVYELSRMLHGEIQDSFGSSRILIWRETLELVSERPLTGGGPGTLPLRLSIEFKRFVAETGKMLHTSVDNAHNVYLGMLVDCGIPALLFYVSAIAVTLINAARKVGSRPASAAVCCGLLAYWVQDFFGLGLFIVTPVVWILWGLAGTTEKLPSEILSDISSHEDSHDGGHHEAAGPAA